MKRPEPLVLIPTETERQHVDRMTRQLGFRIELCGFGLVAAAARSSHLLSELKPSNVILLGIAGSLSDDLAVGHAYEFDALACYGIGIGAAAEHIPAGRLGWEHWPGPPSIGDRILLRSNSSRLLLSCCSASLHPEEAAAKLLEHSDAVAEDMEGFAVAAACRMADVPLRVIRGISNRAGNRDHAQWQIEAAMKSAIELTANLVNESA